MPLDSGELTVWRGANTAPSGGMPVMAYTQIWGSYYQARTIGVNRYYTAQQHGDRADVMVRVHRTYDVNPATDKVILNPYDHKDGNAYRITQKQDVEDDNGLPATDLTLERDEGIDAGTITGSAGGAG